jgi:UDP-N-acetylmuramoyl-tripeptide--D-alanyl-D-alanine ligase
MLTDLISSRDNLGKFGAKLRRFRRGSHMPGPFRRFRPRIILARSFRRLWRRTKVVAITGSSGKTTATAVTGVLLRTAMRTEVHVYDGTMGPISRRLISLKPWRTDALVVETGIYSRGDMKIMADMVRPDIAIVTVVGLEHIISFRTREDVAREKGELVAAVPPGGVAILNGDDPHVRGMAERCRGSVIFFGHDEDATLRLHAVEHRWPKGLWLDLSWRGERFSVTCPLVGTHWVPSILGPLAAALSLGIDKARCVEALAAFEAPFNRMSVHPTPAGRTFILDAYKGAHWQINTTVSFLSDIAAPRKTIVFGTLSDRWGSVRSRYYAAARVGLEQADRVIFAGPEAVRVRRMVDRQEDGRLQMIPKVEDVIAQLAEDIMPGEVIYLKSTRNTKLERILWADFLKVRCRLETCDLVGSCRNCPKLTDEQADLRGRRRSSTPTVQRGVL